MNLVRNLNRIAVRLPADAEQYRRLAIRAHNGVDGRDSRCNRPHIANSYRHVVDVLDNDAADFPGTVDLAVHQTEE